MVVTAMGIYDCTIDLLPETAPPKGRLYSLSALEREAMDRYITSALEYSQSAKRLNSC